MTDTFTKATKDQVEQAQKLLLIACLPPDSRMECEGIISLGFELQVVELIKNLEKLITEKETAYNEYKKTVKDILLDESAI